MRFAPEVKRDNHHPDLAHRRMGSLLRDGWVLASLVSAVLLAAFPYFSWIAASVRTFVTESLSMAILLSMVVGAHLRSASRSTSWRGAVFWRLSAVGFSLWLVGDVLSLFIVTPENARAGVTVDGCYLLYYLALVLALDIRPSSGEADLRLQPLRVLSIAGKTFFVTGLFVYLVILPRFLGVEEYLTWYPSFTLYIVLDAYLALGFLRAAVKARHRAWRIAYAGFSVAQALVLTTDAMDLGWLAGLVPDAAYEGTDLLWYLPAVLLVCAARLVQASPTARDDGDDGRPSHGARGTPLLVYSLGFAAIHLTVDLIRPGSGSLGEVRTIMVIGWLMAFSVLHLFQNGIIRRWALEQDRRRLEAENRVRLLSRQDPLTGLLNRRALEEEMEKAIARADRSAVEMAVLFIDLDGFKAVNDSFGHHEGDRVLREVTGRLQGCTREIDTLGRFGGDEFVLLVEGLGHSGVAETVAGRITDALTAGFRCAGEVVSLSASIGIAFSRRRERSPAQLFELADRAMYSVKEAGGSGIAIAGEGISSRGTARR